MARSSPFASSGGGSSNGRTSPFASAGRSSTGRAAPWSATKETGGKLTKYAQVQALRKEAESGGILDSIKGALAAPTNIVMKALNILDYPRAVVVSGTKELIDLTDQLVGDTDDKREGSPDKNSGASLADFWNQVTGHYGFGDLIREEEMTGGNKWGDRALGFAGDVLMDPLTYVSGGAVAAARGGSKAVAREGVEAGAEGISRALLGKEDVVRRLEGLVDNGLTREEVNSLQRKVFKDGTQALSRDIQNQIGIRSGLTWGVGKESRVVIPGTEKLAKGLGVAGGYGRRAGMRTIGKIPGVRKLPELFEAVPGYAELAKKDQRTAWAYKTAWREATDEARATGVDLAEELKRLQELHKDIDPDKLRKTIEKSGTHKYKLPAGAAAFDLQGWFETVRQKANELGVDIPKYEDYLPHRLTDEFREAMIEKGGNLGREAGKGGTPTFKVMRNYRKNGGQKFLGVELTEGTIDEMERIARDTFGDDYIQLFNDDPWELAHTYLYEVSRRLQMSSFYKRLESKGLSVELLMGKTKKAVQTQANLRDAAFELGRKSGKQARKASALYQLADDFENLALTERKLPKEFSSASARLKNAHADVVAALRALPEQPTREALDAAMQAFDDARIELANMLRNAERKGVKQVDVAAVRRELVAASEGIQNVRHVLEADDAFKAAAVEGTAAAQQVADEAVGAIPSQVRKEGYGVQTALEDAAALSEDRVARRAEAVTELQSGEFGDMTFRPSLQDDGTMYLSNLQVPEKLRGTGAGTRAMEDLTQTADRAGLDLTLHTGAARDDLREWYARFGFEPMEPDELGVPMRRTARPANEGEAIGILGNQTRDYYERTLAKLGDRAAKLEQALVDIEAGRAPDLSGMSTKQIRGKSKVAEGVIRPSLTATSDELKNELIGLHDEIARLDGVLNQAADNIEQTRALIAENKRLANQARRTDIEVAALETELRKVKDRLRTTRVPKSIDELETRQIELEDAIRAAKEGPAPAPTDGTEVFTLGRHEVSFKPNPDFPGELMVKWSETLGWRPVRNYAEGENVVRNLLDVPADAKLTPKAAAAAPEADELGRRITELSRVRDVAHAQRQVTLDKIRNTDAAIAARKSEMIRTGGGELTQRQVKKLDKQVQKLSAAAGTVQAEDDVYNVANAARRKGDELLLEADHELGQAELAMDTVRGKQAAVVERQVELGQKAVEILGSAKQVTDDNLRTSVNLQGAAAKAEAKAAKHAQASAELWRESLKVVSDEDINKMHDILTNGFREFADGKWADPDVADALAKLTKAMEPQEVKKFLRFYDQMMSRWKAYSLLSPGFHIRNYMGGMFNNSLAGIDPSMYFKYERAVRQFNKGGIDAITNKTVREHFREAMRHELVIGTDQIRDLGDIITLGGVTDNGLLGNKLRFGRKGGRGAEAAGMNLDLTALDNPLLNVNHKAGNMVERHLRMPLFMDSLAKGMTVEEALDRVRKYHFDYRDGLSQFERKVGKRVFPFYTWTRFNFPLQVEMMFRRPGRYTAYLHAKRNIEMGLEEEEVVPAYYSTLLSIHTPFKAQSGGDIYLTPDLPFRDVSETFNTGTLLGQLSPAIKVPLESLAGKQFFSDIPFRTGASGMTEVPKAYYPILPFLLAADKVPGLGLPRAQFLNGQFWMQDKDAYKIDQALPLLGRMRRLAPTEQRYKDRWQTTTWSTIGGVSSRTNSDDAQYGELLRQERIIKDALKRKGILEEGS